MKKRTGKTTSRYLAHLRREQLQRAITYLEVAAEALDKGYEHDGKLQTDIYCRAGYARGSLGCALDMLKKIINPNIDTPSDS